MIDNVFAYIKCYKLSWDISERREVTIFWLLAGIACDPLKARDGVGHDEI